MTKKGGLPFGINDAKKSSQVSNTPDEVSTFRRILPQILASLVKNLLLLDLGLSGAFPTILIPALTGFANEHNVNEYLRMSPLEASWFGSIAWVCEPIGAALSGWIAEPLGRKRAMFLVNIPHVIGWIMMYKATTITEVFVANILFGLGIGLMEAPIITYVGEITEPAIRGVLVSCAEIAVTLGFLITFLLGSLMAWRTAALMCVSIPVLAMIALCFVPETPLWLLSKNRKEEAQQSLQWLRGWVSPQAVAREFKSLQRYNERSNSCNACVKQNVRCTHAAPTIMDKLLELTRKRTLKPLLLVTFMGILSHLTGVTAIRPYMIQILNAYGVLLDANLTTVIIGIVELIGNILVLCLVRLTGKRRIYLFALAATAFSCFVLAVYGFIHLPAGWSSIEKHESMSAVGTKNYVPLFAIISLSFASSLGVFCLPWMLFSEVFPFRARGLVTGISAGANYFLGFLGTKTYYNSESVLSMPGASLLYGIIGAVGFIIMYFILPETENHSLEDIELHFSDNLKKITDRKILKRYSGKNTGNLEATVLSKQISTISDNLPDNTECIDNDACGCGTWESMNTGCVNRAFAVES